MAKAIGVGGVFLKARDPKALAAWYATHLGIPTQDGGSLAFDGPESTGMTVFAHFPLESRYFGDGPQHPWSTSASTTWTSCSPVGRRRRPHRPQARRLPLRPFRLDLGPGRQPHRALAAPSLTRMAAKSRKTRYRRKEPWNAMYDARLTSRHNRTLRRITDVRRMEYTCKAQCTTRLDCILLHAARCTAQATPAACPRRAPATPSPLSASSKSGTAPPGPAAQAPACRPSPPAKSLPSESSSTAFSSSPKPIGRATAISPGLPSAPITT